MIEADPTLTVHGGTTGGKKMRRGGYRFAMALLFMHPFGWGTTCALRSQEAPPEAPVPSLEVLRAQQERIQAMALAIQSTVGVFGTDGDGGGSGVIISEDGYVLTNFHVSSPFGNRMRCGLADGTMYEAVVTAIDPTGDLALLKMYGRDSFPYASVADSDAVQVGQWCFAAGNPFVLATNLKPTVTFGLVSGVRRYQYPAGTILEYTDCIQTDAAINPGNSGGPLYNMRGELIGINGRCSFEKRGRVNVGVGYAISINQAMNFLGILKSGRWVDHATLGFTVTSDPEGRVVVSNILSASDAFRRGIRYGDRVLSIGDRPIANVNQLKNIVGIYPSNWRIPVQVQQADGVLSTLVRLSRLHTDQELQSIIEGQSNQPKPDEKPRRKPNPPQDKRPSDKKDDETPELPKPREPGDARSKKPTEEARDPLADRYEKREGFTNFYFNRIELERILRIQARYEPWKSTPGAWQISGNVVGEKTPVKVECTEKNIRWTMADQEFTHASRRGWLDPIHRQQASCLALAMHLWRGWHSQGPKNLGDAIYAGQVPLMGKRPLVDQTEITLGEVTAFFHSSPTDGRIQCIELKGDPDHDSAEVYFEGESVQGALPYPHRVRLQYGIEPRLWVEWKDCQALEPPQPVDQGSIEGVPK
jgi:S1-C subfamily serine protease